MNADAIDLVFPDQIDSARLRYVRPPSLRLEQGRANVSATGKTETSEVEVGGAAVGGAAVGNTFEVALSQLHDLFSQSAVAKYCGFRAHQDQTESRAKLRDMAQDWQDGRAYSYLIYRRDDPSRLIGNQHIKPQGSRLNLGCAFSPDQWRQGFALEATRFWLDWGLCQPRIWRVEAFCDADHPASRGVMEQAGMQYEGRLRRFFQQPEVQEAPRDVLMYACVREDIGL